MAGTCFCPVPHAGRRWVFSNPGHGATRCRYYDPMQFVDRLGGLVVQSTDLPGVMGGDVFGGACDGFGGLGGLGWKDPRDWTTRDFERLQEVLAEMRARQRGRRRRGGGGGGGADEYYDDADGATGRGLRDVRSLLARLETARRLDRVEETVYGDEGERRGAAFWVRLRHVLDGGDYDEDRVDRLGGGGVGAAARRFAQQQREQERRERERRNLVREVEELRRHLERLRDGGREGLGVWRLTEWPL